MSFRLLFLGVACVLLGAGCTNQTWIGFYYPDANDLTIYRESSPLSNLEECRDWVDGYQQELNPTGERDDDYECGRGCQKDREFDGYVCKETVR